MARGSITFVLMVITLILTGFSLLLVSPVWDIVYYYCESIGIHGANLGAFYVFWYILPLISVILCIISAIVESQNPL